jgi:competence protein ComEC
LPAETSLNQGVSCDEAGCVTQMASGAFVALALRPDALGDDCEHAALLVTARQAPTACLASVISGERLRRQGAMALWRTRDGFTVDAVKPRGVDRPWSPGAAGDAEAADTTLAPRPATAPRAVDATPSEADLQAEE